MSFRILLSFTIHLFYVWSKNPTARNTPQVIEISMSDRCLHNHAYWNTIHSRGSTETRVHEWMEGLETIRSKYTVEQAFTSKDTNFCHFQQHDVPPAFNLPPSPPLKFVCRMLVFPPHILIYPYPWLNHYCISPLLWLCFVVGVLTACIELISNCKYFWRDVSL